MLSKGPTMKTCWPRVWHLSGSQSEFFLRCCVLFCTVLCLTTRFRNFGCCVELSSFIDIKLWTSSSAPLLAKLALSSPRFGRAFVALWYLETLDDMKKWCTSKSYMKSAEFFWNAGWFWNDCNIPAKREKLQSLFPFSAPLVMVLRVLRSAHHGPGCSVLTWNDFLSSRLMLSLGSQRSTSGSIQQLKITKNDERMQTWPWILALRQLGHPLSAGSPCHSCDWQLQVGQALGPSHEDLDWRSS